MRRFLVPVLAAALAVGAVAAAPASSGSRADVDHEVEVMIGDAADVDGGVAGGVNPTGNTEPSCGKGPTDYCETILVHLVNPYEEENAKKGRERANAVFTLTTDDGLVSDYDLFVHESDADGTRGPEMGTAGEFPLLIQSSQETVTVSISTTEEVQDAWVLIDVYYFAAPAPYHMNVAFS